MLFAAALCWLPLKRPVALARHAIVHLMVPEINCMQGLTRLRGTNESLYGWWEACLPAWCELKVDTALIALPINTVATCCQNIMHLHKSTLPHSQCKCKCS